MTYQEAIEYLNLPANPTNELVGKRYIELKSDYQKAIDNAPSEHFSGLYQQNLDKIEEAYRFLNDRQNVSEMETKILDEILKVRNVVDQLYKEHQVEELSSESLEIIRQYVNQISTVQDNIIIELPDNQPIKITLPSQRPSVKLESGEIPKAKSRKISTTKRSIKKKAKPLVTSPAANSVDHSITATRSPIPFDLANRFTLLSFKNKVDSLLKGFNQTSDSLENGTVIEAAFIEKWVIIFVVNALYGKNYLVKTRFVNRLILYIIFGILLLSLVGTMYLVFPIL